MKGPLELLVCRDVICFNFPQELNKTGALEQLADERRGLSGRDLVPGRAATRAGIGERGPTACNLACRLC